MAIDFKKTASNNTGNKNAQDERPKSEFWVNIGYNVDVQVTGEGGESSTEQRFVSLPVGLPLDISQKVAIKGNDPEFVALQTARNELLEQLIAHAEASLKPGETTELNLVVQLRRINGAPPVIKSADNPFSKKLTF